MEERIDLVPAGLFEHSQLPMWVYSPKTLAFLDVNDAAIEYYGYSRARFLTMAVPQLHLPDDRTEALPAALRAPAAGRGPETWRHVKRDGTVVYVDISRVPVEISGESAYLVTANDVSAGKKAELLYRVLMDAVPSSVLLLNEDLRVVFANRNFLEKSRQSANQTIGRRLTEIFPEVIVSEMDLERKVRNVLKHNEATRGERLTYRTPGVPIRVYYYSVVPISLGSRVDQALLLMDDVTEQTRLCEEIRQMERHLASVVESASDIVLSTDTKGNILTWNKAAQKVSGYAFADVKGRPFLEYCDEALIRRFFSSPAFREASGMTEGNLRTKDGKCRPVSWVLSQMMSDAGQTIGFVVVGRDLTERRKFEMEMQESQKLASLGVMARGIAHEIRTPLTIASSSAQFLMEGELTPEFQYECAEKVYGSIRKASSIVQNLLRFAQPTTDVTRMPLDLVPIVTAALNTIENQASVQNVKICTSLPSQPCRVLGVSGLLEQVFMNLFLNSINAMPNGGTLDVSVDSHDQEILFRVTDTGEGIAPEDLGKIFDPFFTTAAPGKGTGLGLSICYSIVDQHKGSISVDSQKGHGSTFSVRLPPLALTGNGEP